MIIKEIRIRNFRSYYGDNNVFEFSEDGLTLILGDNGDGKTTFFEALQWLFNTSTNNRENRIAISEMKKSELGIGEKEKVSVFMSFEHDGEKSIEKSFEFERSGNGIDDIKLSDQKYIGFISNGVEREPVNGAKLIERCYDAFLQRFTMLKGESKLNVFDDPTALKDLVNKFSEIHQFDKLVDNAKIFKEKANREYSKELAADAKVSADAKALDLKIERKSAEIATKKKDISEKQISLDALTKRITLMEESYGKTEQFNEIQERLKAQQKNAVTKRGQIGKPEQFSWNLLDKMWVLAPFPKILKDFQKKCADLSKERRRLEKEYEKQKNIELGKLEAVKEMQGALVNGATELPWYLPNQETMEEMLKDRICKVCGREAPEGSEAYHFMVHKLELYKQHVEAKVKKELEKKQIEEQNLYSNEYIEELHEFCMSLSGSQEAKINSIAQQAYDHIAFVESRKEELKNIEEKIQEILDEKTRLLIQASNLPDAIRDNLDAMDQLDRSALAKVEDALSSGFNDYKGLSKEKGRYEVELAQLKGELGILLLELKDYQEKKDGLNPESLKVKTLRDVHRVLEAIARAFVSARNYNYTQFLVDLQTRSNEYLVKLSANDFHGEIHLIRTKDESAEIRLFSTNGVEIVKPSGSQKTAMYLSVLLGISDFAQIQREERFPLIFDAATSSFGDLKEAEFYNTIGDLRKQCIIVTKDFFTMGELRTDDVMKLNCPVFRIKKAKGFDPTNLATIRTTVEKIK